MGVRDTNEERDKKNKMFISKLFKKKKWNVKFPDFSLSHVSKKAYTHKYTCIYKHKNLCAIYKCLTAEDFAVPHSTPLKPEEQVHEYSLFERALHVPLFRHLKLKAGGGGGRRGKRGRQIQQKRSGWNESVCNVVMKQDYQREHRHPWQKKKNNNWVDNLLALTTIAVLYGAYGLGVQTPRSMSQMAPLYEELHLHRKASLARGTHVPPWRHLFFFFFLKKVYW